MSKIIITIILLSITRFIFSQGDDPISTDRPGYTNPPSVVPKHSFQIESGFNYQYDNSTGDQAKDYTEPTILMRYGLLKNFEVRVEFDVFEQDSRSPVTGMHYQHGLAPVIIGTKYYISKQKGGWPETAFSFNLTLPYFGYRFFRPQYAAPAITFLFQNTFSEKFSIGYNAGLQWNGNDANPTGTGTFALGYNFTKKLSGFAEIYSYYLEGQTPDYRTDAGFAYLVSNNFQVDISGGHGITNISPDYFINAGISLRLPR